MTYFATCFAMSLVGLRFRVRIDLDDEPEVHTPELYVHAREPQHTQASTN